MQLETNRLILRELRAEDAQSIFENVASSEVVKYLASLPYPYYLKDAQWYVARQLENQQKNPRDNYAFGITLKENGRVIGAIELKAINFTDETSEIGYWLGEKYWRQGIVSEATLRVIQFAFEELKLRRLNICAVVPNEGSNKIIRKMGFTLEGVKRQEKKSKVTGEIFDLNEYGLLREEWLKKAKNL